MFVGVRPSVDLFRRFFTPNCSFGYWSNTKRGCNTTNGSFRRMLTAYPWSSDKKTIGYGPSSTITSTTCQEDADEEAHSKEEELGYQCHFLDGAMRWQLM
uniref:Uncharacterized protein n=1 Tax=Oryza punctata TaxID=4537 RepID=A0A0E0LZX5_ORYPU